MGRKFVRMSLGGIHDEAEIRGHRRTYIGALPGRDHPEHQDRGHEQPGLHARRGRQDRHGLPGRPELGAPRGARPGAEQHLPGQLPRGAVRPLARCCSSRPATCSTRSRPALRDRMEIIQLPGYTQQEKIEIGKRFLIPKQMANHGLTSQAHRDHRRGDDELVQAVHPRGRRPEPRARDRQRHAQGRPAGRRGPQAQDRRRRQEARSSSSGRRASSTASWSPRTRSARRRGSS